MLASLDANGWATVIAAIGVVFVQLYGMYLSHVRNAETKALLAKQDEKSAEQGEKLATVLKQTDGLLEKVGDIRQQQGEYVGAERERLKQVEIDAAVIVAGRQQVPSDLESAPIPVVVENVKPVKVTETK